MLASINARKSGVTVAVTSNHNFQAGGPLVQQHSQPANRFVAACLCRRKKRCFQRRVDDIRRDRIECQSVKTQIQRRLADHPQRCRVDDNRCSVERFMALIPSQNGDRATDILGQFLGANRGCD